MPELTSLKLLEYSDKELIAIVNDHIAEDGWARTNDIRETIGLPEDTGNQSVGVRLAWLKRYGIVENGGQKKWRLTPIGEVFLNGKLPKRLADSLDHLEPGELHTATRVLARRQKKSADSVGHMIRREWAYGTGGKR